MDHLLSFIYRSLLLNFGVFCSVVAPVTAQLVSSQRNSTFNRSAQNADTGQQHKILSFSHSSSYWKNNSIATATIFATNKSCLTSFPSSFGHGLFNRYEHQ